MSSGSSVTHDLFTHACLILVAQTILYFDYIITLPHEIVLVWGHAISWPFVLFFMNRYVPVVGDIVILVFNLSSFASAEGICRRFGLARQLLLILNQVNVSLLLALRIIALYNNSKRIIAFVVSSAVVLFTIACWSISGQHSHVVHSQNAPGCWVATTAHTGIYLSVGWLMQSVFDLIIFILTVIHTLRTRRSWNNGVNFLRTPSGLIELVYRDGAIYFITMALANFVNILTFYFLSDALRGSLSTFASSISVTMMSRLMLNLYAAVAKQGPRTIGGPNAEFTVNMIFTTHIDAMPSLGDSSGYDSDEGAYGRLSNSLGSPDLSTDTTASGPQTPPATPQNFLTSASRERGASRCGGQEHIEMMRIGRVV